MVTMSVDGCKKALTFSFFVAIFLLAIFEALFQ